MSMIRIAFILTGALAGKTINLGHLPYRFEDGRTVLEDAPDQLALHARFLERNWQAYPEGHPALEEKANGQRDLQEAPQPNGDQHVPSDSQPEGVGAAPSEPVAVSEGAAESAPGIVVDAGGNGPAAELNTKLQKAVFSLDPADDSHWTADGKPAMTAVERLYGSAGITRADVEAVAPAFNRRKAQA